MTEDTKKLIDEARRLDGYEDPTGLGKRMSAALEATQAALTGTEATLERTARDLVMTSEEARVQRERADALQARAQQIQDEHDCTRRNMENHPLRIALEERDAARDLACRIEAQAAEMRSVLAKCTAMLTQLFKRSKADEGVTFVQLFNTEPAIEALWLETEWVRHQADAGYGWLSPADRMKAREHLEAYRCADVLDERRDPQEIDRAIIILQFDPEDRPARPESDLQREIAALEKTPEGRVRMARARLEVAVADLEDERGCPICGGPGPCEHPVEIAPGAKAEQFDARLMAPLPGLADVRAAGIDPAELQRPCRACCRMESGWRWNRCPNCGELADPNETQASINAWQDETFGTKASATRRASRYLEEFAELLRKIVAIDEGDTEKIPAALEECADNYLMLVNLVHKLGGNLQIEVDRKMAINRKRTWKTDGTGCSYHVKAGGESP